MRVLLDECVDWRLSRDLVGHEVRTARQMGWSSRTESRTRGARPSGIGKHRNRLAWGGRSDVISCRTSSLDSVSWNGRANATSLRHVPGATNALTQTFVSRNTLMKHRGRRRPRCASRSPGCVAQDRAECRPALPRSPAPIWRARDTGPATGLGAGTKRRAASPARHPVLSLRRSWRDSAVTDAKRLARSFCFFQ